MPPKRKMDKASQQLLDLSQKEGFKVFWDRFMDQQPQCGFGSLGVCCTMCNLGPCRVDPFGEGPQKGVCGADAEIITSRNMARSTAAGAASHSDHAREMAHTLQLVGEGKAPGYKVNAPTKLRSVAKEYGILTEDRTNEEIAKDLGKKMLEEFGQQKGELVFSHRAPKKQQEFWRSYNIMPRGIDIEVVETICHTHEGMDNDYKNLIRSGMKAALADGWGGSMIATEISDILFGTPQPVRAKADLGVLKEDEVNILMHGHQPTLSDVIAQVASEKEMIDLAKKNGAKGIVVAGICCTANEMLVRRGIPIAGSFLQQELALLTGAVEAFVVDIQCIMPATAELARNFHTKFISTSGKARFLNVEHIEFKEEEALEIAKKIVRVAVENFKNRDKSRVHIPKETMELVAGFTAENVFYHLGGKFRPSYRPLNDNIINGHIRGVAAVVGCDNPKNQNGLSHIDMVKELIKNDVLVVQTGCAAISCAKAGLLTPEAAIEMAGDGLKSVCRAVGIPPVLHEGACIDNSRILIQCCEMVKEGGIGNSLDELPVAGAAPEWMSEKAIAIGWYCVASGIFVVFGTPLKVLGSKIVTDHITKEMENISGGKWAFEDNPIKAAHLMIDHIDKKRAALKLQPMKYRQAYAVA